MSKEAEELAEAIHNKYEELASSNNWNTQESCKVSFEDLPKANKETMIGIAEFVLHYTNKKVLEALEEVENYSNTHVYSLGTIKTFPQRNEILNFIETRVKPKYKQ